MNQKRAQQTRGYQAEQVVARRLQQEGFAIIARNYRKFFGEIDIIAQKKDLLIFVEVKMRTNTNIDPAEIIMPQKQKKIVLVAKEYLAAHTIENMICRFDVALVIEQHNSFEIRYIANAFNTFD